MSERGAYLQSEVLKVLQEHAEPMSAYDILSKMQKEDVKLAPPTVYRTLAALQKKNSIHRLESLNAYVLCKEDCEHTASILSICDDCGTVEENISHELMDNLSQVVGEKGFSAHRHIVEIHGTCGTCNEEAAK